MALFLFTKAILEGRPIDVFNHGKMRRDFTYIDDIAEGVIRVLDRPAAGRPGFDKQHPRPGDQLGALPRVQHRQPPAGGTDGLHRGAGAGAGQDRAKNFLPLQDGDVPRVTGFSPGHPWSKACAALSIGTGAT
jgi:UDP-glucuronate 4-epimerase